MGLPAWAYDEEDSEWEDRGPYLYNRKTGQKVPKGAAGGLTNLTKPGDLPPEELQRRLVKWKAENDAMSARGESDGEDFKGPSSPFVKEVLGGFGTGTEPTDFRERLEAATRGMGDENLEDRTDEVTLPHWIDSLMMKYAPPYRGGRPRTGPSWLPREVIPYKMSEGYERRKKTEEQPDPGPPQGWPHGWGRTYDPRWINPDSSIRRDAPEEVRRGIDESAELAELQSERGLIEDQYEPTRSPLVLRKRNANGTVTYVHAMTGQELFDLGEYGLNDPQGAERENPWDPVRDPYWRSGRREW